MSNTRMEILCRALNESSLTHSPEWTDRYIEHGTYPKTHFFPFSNEYNFDDRLGFLETYPPLQTAAIRVAILTGESHILSMLPEIACHADIVICNDIDSRVIAHIKHMLRSMQLSDVNTFFDVYLANNPLSDQSVFGTRYSRNYLFDQLFNISKMETEKYFLHSHNRFTSCKIAMRHLRFIFTSINLLDINKVSDLANILTSHNAIVTILNLTNIHSYDPNMRLTLSIPKLLSGYCYPFILYSDMSQGLSSHIRIGFNNYAKNVFPLYEKNRNSWEKVACSISFFRANREHPNASSHINDIIPKIMNYIR